MAGVDFREKAGGLAAFFFPRSVAVVGASLSPSKSGYVMLQNLLDYEYAGQIIPINPTHSEILGLKSYPSLQAHGHPVDLAIIMVATEQVPDAIRDCAAAGVKNCIVHSGGLGKEEEEREVLATARAAGLRLVGPNCTGILCPKGGLPWTRMSLPPRVEGGIGVISQSGSGSGTIVNIGRQRGLEFSKVVSVGNQCDLGVLDFLEFLGEDPDTRAICLYLESVKDGQRFLAAARAISLKKPILAYKIGRTEAGRLASISHTGSLTTSFKVYQAAFRQGGVIQAASLEEMVDLLLVFSSYWYRSQEAVGGRVGIVTGPGAPGIAAADNCLELGLQVPPYSGEVQERLRAVVYDASCQNPVDMGLRAFMAENDPYFTLAQIASSDPGVESVLVIGPSEFKPQEFMRSVLRLKEACPKPLFVSWTAQGGDVDACWAELDRAGVPLYLTPERAVRALAGVARYSAWRGVDRNSHKMMIKPA